MKKSLKILFVVLLAMCFASCAGTLKTSVTVQELTEINDGKFGLHAWVEDGGFLFVEIPGNPTTGYEWTCSIRDEDILDDYFSAYHAAAGQNLVGAGGYYSFGFKSLKEGKTVLTFYYARAWELSALTTVSYTISVDSNLNISVSQ